MGDFPDPSKRAAPDRSLARVGSGTHRAAALRAGPELLGPPTFLMSHDVPSIDIKLDRGWGGSASLAGIIETGAEAREV